MWRGECRAGTIRLTAAQLPHLLADRRGLLICRLESLRDWRTVFQSERRTEAKDSRESKADQTTGLIGVREAVVGVVGYAGREFIPATHAVAVGGNEPNADEGFRCVIVAGEVSGDAHERLSRCQDVDQWAQYRILLNESDYILVMGDPVGGWVS